MSCCLEDQLRAEQSAKQQVNLGHDVDEAGASWLYEGANRALPELERRRLAPA